MKDTDSQHKLLLHACCGPCSLEPIRVLRQRGIEPTVFFSNSNIAPAHEYEARRDAIKKWAEENDVEFIEDTYDNDEWKNAVRECSGAKPDRCRECYRMRLKAAANYAKENGFDEVSTTLTISPYQHTDIIEEELNSACRDEGITSGFEDFSQYYRTAQTRAKEEGVYKQKYCGCLLSKKEAEDEIAEMKQSKAKAHKKREEELNKKRAENKAYEDKQARKKELMKRFKEGKC